MPYPRTVPGMIRLPPPADVALAAGVGAVALAGTALSDDVDARPWWPGGALLIGAGVLVLAWRRRAPLTVLALTVAVVAPYYWLGYPDGPASILVAVAMYTVASRLSWPRSVAAGLGVLVVWVGIEQVMILQGRAVDDRDRYLWLAVTVAVGVAVGGLRRAQTEAAQRAEEQARRRVDEERLRLAREVHDVVSHGLAGIAVQAGVGAHVADRRPEQAVAALREIRDASRAALGELRAVLDVVRDHEPADADTALGLHRLREVTRVAGLAGLDVEVRGSAGVLDPPVDRVAFRIVREAITNAVRHARGARRVTVDLERGDVELRVRVADDGAAAGIDAAPGHGLRGVAEHAAALGGRAASGPGPDGGFVVEATLPLAGRA